MQRKRFTTEGTEANLQKGRLATISVISVVMLWGGCSAARRYLLRPSSAAS